MSIKPIQFDVVMRDKTRESWDAVQKGAQDTSDVVKMKTDELKVRMQEQAAVIKHVENDIKSLKKEISTAAPGKMQAELIFELEAAERVLNEEKAALIGLQNEFGKSAGKAVTLRTQIANLKQEMAQMEEGTEEYMRAMQRLGELQDRFSDISQQGRVLADDENRYKATAEAMSGLAGALSAGVGVASLFGAEEEKLAQIQTKLQSVMAITIGLQQVATVLNKDSYFSIVLLGKAKTFLTMANYRLAVSLGISTAAAKTFMATITLGLSVVITGLVMLLDKYISSVSSADAAQKKLIDTHVSTTTSISELSRRFVRLKGDLKGQTEFIRENREAFSKLGAVVRDVADAENLLIKNKRAFIDAQIAKAKSIAMLDSDEYREAQERALKAELDYQKYAEQFNKGGKGKKATNLDKIKVRGQRLYIPNSNAGMREAAWEYVEANKKLREIQDRAINYEMDYQNKMDSINARAKAKMKGTLAERREEIARLKEEREQLSQADDIRKTTAEIKRKEDELSRLEGQTKKVQKFNMQGENDALLDAEINAHQRINEQTIRLMQEGAEKRKAEAKLSFEAELIRIAREGRERQKAIEQAKKNGIKVTRDEENAVVVQVAQERALAMELYAKEYERIERESLDGLLQKHQDSMTQRLAIEKKYNDDIDALVKERARAQSEGNAAQVEEINRAIAQATVSKGKELMNFDFERLKESPDYVRAFEDLKEASNETLKSLIEQLQQAKMTAAEVLDPMQLREYTTTIQSIMDELDARNPFQALAVRKRELAESEVELARAKRDLEAVKGGNKVVETVRMSDKTNKLERVYLSEAKAQERLNQATDRNVKANTRKVKAEQSVLDMGKKLTDTFSELGRVIGGQAGEILSLIGDVANFGISSMGAISALSDTTKQKVSELEKASVILAVISAAMQIAIKLSNLLGGDDGVKKYERAKEVYESYIAILDKIIEKEKELFSLNSKNGERAVENSKKLLEEKARVARELGRQYLDAGAKSGLFGIGSSASHGVQQKGDISTKAWKELIRVMGREEAYRIKDGRMEALFDLSAAQIRRLQNEATLFYAELNKEVQEFLNAIVAAQDAVERLEGERQAGLLGFDKTSWTEDWQSWLQDLDMSNKDFADKFEERIRDSILRSLVVNKYKSKIEALYSEFAKKTESGNELTRGEVDELRRRREELATEMLKERESMMRMLGINSATASQSGKTGVFSAMSQEQGTKLEGLFTSVQDHVNSIDNKMDRITVAMDKAVSALSVIAENTSYCRMLHDISECLERLERNGIKTKD